MKRKIISWLLAIACCLSLLPRNLVIAEEVGEKNLPVTTVAYFTNLASYPQSDVYAQAVTVTGSAFIDIGGKTRWDYGLIIIEPKQGYTFDKAWYPSVGYQQNEYNENNSNKFEVSNVRNVLKELGTIDANRPSIINEAVKGKDECMAIKIDSVLFNNIIGKTIYLDFRQANTGESVRQRFYINSNEFSLKTKEVKANENFDLFDYNIFQGNGFQKTDFKITGNKFTGFSSPSIPKEILKQVDTGKYSISQEGIYNFMLSNDKNGMRYFVQVNVVYNENSPLKEESITVSDNAIVNYNNISCGMITVQPKNKQDFLMKNVDFLLNLPEGAVVDWNSVKVNNLEANKEKPLTYTIETGISGILSEEVNIKLSIVEENGKQKLFVSGESKSDKKPCGLKIYITFDINYMNKKYSYTISFVPNTYVGFMGGRTYYIAPDEPIDIFNFLSVYGNNEAEIEQNKQRFLDNVKNKTYTLIMSGATSENLSDLSRTNKEVTFSRSGNEGLYIYDNDLKTLVNGWSLQIVMQPMTYIKYIDIDNKYIDIKTEFGKYIEDIPYTVEGRGDFTLESKYIYPNTENSEGIIDIKQNDSNRLLGEFAIQFTSKANINENLIKTIQKMPKEGGKALFLSMTNDERAEISVDILNALMQSTSAINNSKGNRLVVMVKSSSGNDIEWEFNSATMNNAIKKNIVLNIQIGDDVENTNINQILEEKNEKGLKLGFEDNSELPRETKVRLYLSDEEIEMIGGNIDINLYSFNSNIQQMAKERRGLVKDGSGFVKEKSGLYIDSRPNGRKYISIPVTHNNDFVLSTASDLDKNTSNSSGTISGGGISIVYTPAPTTAPTATPVATPTVAPTIVPTAIPTAASTPVPTTAPVVTSTPEPTATPVVMPTTVPSETAIPDATPTVVPSDKNKVKKVKAVKKKVTVEKNKKLDVNFKVTATDNKKAVQNKVKATIKNKKIAKVVKTKVKARKAVVTVKGRKKGKTVLKLNIGGKTAKTTIKVK